MLVIIAKLDHFMMRVHETTQRKNKKLTKENTKANKGGNVLKTRGHCCKTFYRRNL
jgi:hypothetical protein